MESLRGVPATEHRVLSEKYRALEHTRHEAMEKGDDALVSTLHLQCIQAGKALAEFLQRHLKTRNRS